MKNIFILAFCALALAVSANAYKATTPEGDKEAVQTKKEAGAATDKKDTATTATVQVAANQAQATLDAKQAEQTPVTRNATLSSSELKEAVPGSSIVSGMVQQQQNLQTPPADAAKLAATQQLPDPKKAK